MPDDDGLMRFCVEASDRFDDDEPLEFFQPTIELARAQFEVAAKRFQCVWLCEYGICRGDGRSLPPTWIYYFWTRAALDEEPRGRFEGYPDWGHDLLPYVPCFRDGRPVPNC